MTTIGEKKPENTPESTDDLRKEIDRLLGDITVKLSSDEQKQQTVLSVAETVMSNWSAGNPFKKLISFLALKTMPTLPADGAESDRTGPCGPPPAPCAVHPQLGAVLPRPPCAGSRLPRGRMRR